MAPKSTKKTTKKAASTPGEKQPRMSKSAARAEGAAKTERLRRAVLAEINDRLEGEHSEAPPTDTKAAENDKDPKERKPKRVSGLDLAAKVLADAGEPLNAKTIAERAIAAGWKTSGKTPEATLYAAIVREIARKGADARFARHDRGLFAATPTTPTSGKEA